MKTRRERGGQLLRLQVLLIGLIAVLVLSPMLQGSVIGRIALSIGFSIILIDAVFAVSSGRKAGITATALALPLLWEFWTNQMTDQVLGSAHLGISVGVPFFLLVTVQVLRFVVRPGPVTPEKLLGAACAYLLLGYSFAGVYGALEHFIPGSFDHAELTAGEPATDWVDFVYYSFVTLTTLGYGDISPIKPTVRAVSAFEAVVGILYIAFIIASLVGSYRPSPEESKE